MEHHQFTKWGYRKEVTHWSLKATNHVPFRFGRRCQLSWLHGPEAAISPSEQQSFGSLRYFETCWSGDRKVQENCPSMFYRREIEGSGSQSYCYCDPERLFCNCSIREIISLMISTIFFFLSHKQHPNTKASENINVFFKYFIHPRNPAVI